MIVKKLSVVCIAVSLTGCAAVGNQFAALGTMKNPRPILSSPSGPVGQSARHPFVEANFNVLRKATRLDGETASIHPYDTSDDAENPVSMQDYLSAGFALSDMYCDEFFRDAEESQRRRRYGRAITNDVGTAMSTILGLANAGQNVVTGVAAGFGVGDSLWRNYDEAFVVSPDLSNVRSLVIAAQDVFRKKTFEADLPRSYSTAQSVILRYANQCSTLGMQSLLNQSASEQQQQLQAQVEEQETNDDPPDGENAGQERNDAQPMTAPVAIPVEPASE